MAGRSWDIKELCYFLINVCEIVSVEFMVGSTSATSSRIWALQQQCYKEINFPALSSEVNILFILTERRAATHKITGVLGTQVLHETSVPCLSVRQQRAAAFWKEIHRCECSSAKVVINLGASA